MNNHPLLYVTHHLLCSVTLEVTQMWQTRHCAESNIGVVWRLGSKLKNLSENLMIDVALCWKLIRPICSEFNEKKL